jgi:hypothetical protein
MMVTNLPINAGEGSYGSEDSSDDSCMDYATFDGANKKNKNANPSPEYDNTIFRKYPGSDIWACRNCNLKGDNWFMQKHPCKEKKINKANGNELNHEAIRSLSVCRNLNILFYLQ